MQSPPPLVRPSNLNYLVEPKGPSELTDQDVALLFERLQQQSDQRRADATITIPIAVYQDLMQLRSQLPQRDPWMVWLFGAAVLVWLAVAATAMFGSPNAVYQRQNDELIRQNARLAGRNSKLAEEAIRKPRCSFTLVCK